MKNEFMLITYTGGKYPINAEQEETIFKSPNDANLRINGVYIAKKNIAEIPTLVDYYMQHPDERPDVYPETKLYLTTELQAMTPEKREKALNAIIKGFNKHFEGREIPKASQQLLDHMIERVNS